jgi:hypothetical protein
MPIAMPTRPNFAAARFGLMTNTRTFASPENNSIQRVLLAGAYWTATYTLPTMNRDDAAQWQAFLMQLEGQVNSFDGFDPDARQPRGPATGTPLVKGAGQTGSTLNIDGCTASIVRWMRAGDYFSVNGELKMLTADATTNGSGETTLSFKPALRASPADNAPLTVRNCTVPMIMSDDSQAMWQTGARLAIYDGLTFSAREVFS